MRAEEWDARFTRQAAWTRPMRSQLYRRANLLRAKWVLDVGCGTGVVTEELAERTRGQVIGLDNDPAMIEFARRREGRADYRLGNAQALPFPARHFDVTVCHFLLLWVRDPALVLREMARVTRPGGTILICAEPDYGGRVDYPDLPIARWQIEELRQEGADPFMGRKLRVLLARAGLQAEVGIIPGPWDLAVLRAEYAAEWALLERTLAGHVEPDELRRCQEAERAAIEEGSRLAFVPVFYALARL
jgi:SAM-dependent methyltransferase